MDERKIVAIDLGTSKIALTIAHIEGNNVRIIYYRETPSEGINQSCVFNEAKVIASLSEAVRQAEENTGLKILSAVVCLPKYNIKQMSGQARKERDGDEEITTEELRELTELAKENFTLENPEKDVVYGAVAQSYSDGEDFQMPEDDIAGRYSDLIEGNFKIFIGKKTDIRRCDKVFSKLGIEPARKYFTASTTAKAVLRPSEMESGVALIDFGAGATSVTVYEGGIMRYYGVIPFGGKSISMDIKNDCTISISLAENIKKGFGVCKPDHLQNLNDKVLQISSYDMEMPKQIPVKFLSEIVTARTQEIIEAILYKVQESGFADRLRSGIVITGGCAEMGCCCSLVEEMSGMKTRIGYPLNTFSTTADSCEKIRETSASSSVGMILHAKEEKGLNCTQEDAEYELKKAFAQKVADKEGAKKTRRVAATELDAKAAEMEAAFNERFKDSSPAARAPRKSATPKTGENTQKPTAHKPKGTAKDSDTKTGVTGFLGFITEPEEI